MFFVLDVPVLVFPFPPSSCKGRLVEKGYVFLCCALGTGMDQDLPVRFLSLCVPCKHFIRVLRLTFLFLSLSMQDLEA